MCRGATFIAMIVAGARPPSDRLASLAAARGPPAPFASPTPLAPLALFAPLGIAAGAMNGCERAG
jgi:hypothetical protein